MAANPPSNSKSSATEPIPLTFEDKLNLIWKHHQMKVLGGCAIVLLIVLANGLWDRLQRSRERDIEDAYEVAATPDQLRAFVAAHPDHPLAGVAELRIADEAYAAEKTSDALAGYEKAFAILKSGPLASRAKLGRALTTVQAGRIAEGSGELQQILNDQNEFKVVRTEAAYQLATLAAEAGNSTDVQKYVDQLNQIDPTSTWARRAMMLRASLPTPAVTVPVSPAPTLPSATSPGPTVKLPTK